MPYLIVYVIAGLLMALTSCLRQEASIKQHVYRTVLIVFFWPILILIAPKTFTSTERHDAPEPNEGVTVVFSDLRDLAIKHEAALSEDERGRLNRVAKAGTSGTTFFADSADFGEILRRYWEESIPPEVYHQLNAARWRLREDHDDEDSGIRFSLREPDWFIGFSTEFLKCIAGVDKNKRARVLETIGKLSEAPTTPHGDTVKPLTGDFSGMWRYRIGDDRLIYKPDGKSKQVVLVSFGARGGVYE